MYLHEYMRDGERGIDKIPTAARLTVNIVLKNPDTLFIETHHLGQVDGLRAGVHHHFRVEAPPSEASIFLITRYRNYRTNRAGVKMKSASQ